MTALANSAGGQFILGIESHAGKPVRLDGGVSGPSRRDWIHKVINASTFPAVESVDVFELSEPTGSYYVIDVPASHQAPHQSNDRRYYKRRGSHSEPMEHYEIEDIRNRPKRPLAPLRMALFTEGHLAYIHFRNEHASDAVKDVQCEFAPNFPLEQNRLHPLDQRGLRELRPQAELFFLLDSMISILGSNAESELTVTVRYRFQERLIGESVTFYLADLTNSSIMTNPGVQAIEDLGKKIDKIASGLERLQNTTEKLAQIADATGLRLSQRTLGAMRDGKQLFNPREFDWEGYQIILGISVDEAIALDQAFNVMDSPQGRRARYGKLSEELRAKFEERFQVDSNIVFSDN